MSLRNRLVVPVIFSALALLAGCGSSSTNIIPPPTGGFTDNNLNGTYVFTVSGYDNANGAPYAIVGTVTADGSGNIKGGAIDFNDVAYTPVPNAAVNTNGSGYTVGADGRGTATLVVTTPFGSSIKLDFVLQDSSHGLVTEFDGNASGSGTLDVQTSGTTPTGSYAFSLFGNGDFGTVGDFTIGNGGSLGGLEDYNSGGAIYPNLTLSGQLVVGPSSTPSTVLATSSFSLTFDVFAIDATHLKFIEMDDQQLALEGDAYSQTSASMPSGTLPFTLSGSLLGGSEPFVAGGFMVTDGSNGISSTSTEDYNLNGTSVSTTPVPFSGSYAAAGNGRYILNNFSGFEGASEFAAYPSSAGVFLLEIDSSLGSLSGIAYPAQSSTTFATGQGYGLNLTGDNVGAGGVEVDDIAEFTAASSGAITGYLDENSGSNGPSQNISLGTTSSFSTPSAGRGQIGTGANSINTLNGGFLLTFYTVDGTTVPFIESDGGQVAVGVMLEQDASSSAAAIARAGGKHLYIPPQKLRNRKAKLTQK